MIAHAFATDALARFGIKHVLIPVPQPQPREADSGQGPQDRQESVACHESAEAIREVPLGPAPRKRGRRRKVALWFDSVARSMANGTTLHDALVEHGLAELAFDKQGMHNLYRNRMVSAESASYGGRPTRRTSAWKRGSERSGSKNGCALRDTIALPRCS